MFLGGRGLNILIHKYFSENEGRFIRLVLKVKQQKAIQLQYISLKFYINKFSNQFLLFLHFLGLKKLIVFYVRGVTTNI